MSRCYTVSIKLYAHDGRKIDHAEITMPPMTSEAEAYDHAKELMETSRTVASRLAKEQAARPGEVSAK